MLTLEWALILHNRGIEPATFRLPASPPALLKPLRLCSPWSGRWRGCPPTPSTRPTRTWWRGRAGCGRCCTPSPWSSAPRGSWGWCSPARTSSPATQSTAAGSWRRHTHTHTHTHLFTHGRLTYGCLKSDRAVGTENRELNIKSESERLNTSRMLDYYSNNKYT